MYCARRCSNDAGSFAETGILTALRSLPTFFLRKDIRLGGETIAAGTVDRRLTTFVNGSGVRGLGFAIQNLSTVDARSPAVDEIELESSVAKSSNFSDCSVSSSLCC